MTRVFRRALALTVLSSVGIAGLASAAPPIRGVAEVGILKPVTKIQGADVVTTIKLKNLSKAPIAGLKIDEYWYDKGGNLLPGDSKVVRLLGLGEVATVVLKTKKDAKMNSNTYQFSHANGKVNTRVLPKIE
jgi:hypothetical protein